MILETQVDHVALVNRVIMSLRPYKGQCGVCNVNLYKWPLSAKSTGFSCSQIPSKIGKGLLLLIEKTSHTEVHPIALARSNWISHSIPQPHEVKWIK